LSLLVTRYSSTGTQIGKTLALASDQLFITDPSISTDAAGNAVVAYGCFQGLVFQRVSKDGVVSEPVQTGIVGTDQPAVSLDAKDGLFVGALEGSYVYLRSFDASGKPRAKVFTVPTHRSPAFQYPGPLKIVANADGSGAFVAFNDGNSHANVVA